MLSWRLDSRAADAPILRTLVGQLGLKDVEEIALDSSYLAILVCGMLSELAVESTIIKPKMWTTPRPLDPQAWRGTALKFINDGEDFLERYNNIRPKVERVFSSLKRAVARWLSIGKRRCGGRKAIPAS